MNTAIEIISPLISVALAGVESGREQFRDQKPILYDLLNIPRWNRTGVWVNIPRALGYIYHSLHGSLSLSTNQLDLALNLARVKIPDLDKTELLRVWETEDLIGWFGSFGPNCTDSWEYLSSAYDRWKWLALIFGDESEYRTSLVAYYMALNIHELATIIASGQQDTLKTSRYNFAVPLTFLSAEYDIILRATSLLRTQEQLMALWTCRNVTREQMESSWENWIRSSEKWLWSRYEARRNSMGRHNPIDIFRRFFEGL